MRRYPPEDAHGAGHYYYLVIIRKPSEPFRLLLGCLQPIQTCYRSNTFKSATDGILL